MPVSMSIPGRSPGFLDQAGLQRPGSDEPEGGRLTVAADDRVERDGRAQARGREDEFEDAEGIQSLSMRSLAQTLGVVPMAQYEHVANKQELLDGMVDVVLRGSTPRRTGPTGSRLSGPASWPTVSRCSRTRGHPR